MNTSAATTSQLSSSEWQERRASHHARVIEWTQPMRDRRARGESHPVLDFLHTYYSFSFRKLEDWHPGFGVVLENDSDFPRAFKRPPYQHNADDTQLDPTHLPAKKRDQIGWIHMLLSNTQQRPANFACHGMHEWAMVYSGAEIRHRETVPLRLPQEEIDAIVDAHPLCCTHYDAFRFFAPATQPRNRFLPDLSDREDHEQPACIHANMDLYKWAFKSMPWIGSDLLWECFQFATRCRKIDMRASPYDLSALGYEPIRIETEEGRRDYEREQLILMDEGKLIRQKVIATLENILAASRGTISP